ncbi:MAG: hypothetical protein KAZ09_01710 [Enterococcus sp.]|nr:hypothetical protein [Enterococcus sp.]
MIYAIDLLNMIDTFVAFTILDCLSLRNKKVSMGAIILLFIVINLQLKLVIPVVSELFFVVLLVSLSYMNRREQPIGITLFHFAIAFGVFKLNNFLFYPREVLIFLGLKASEWQIMLYALFTIGIGVATSLLVRKYITQQMNQLWKQRMGYLLFAALLINQFVILVQYLTKIPIESERYILIEMTISFSILLMGIFTLSVLIFSSNQKLAFETKEKEIKQRAMQLYIHDISKQNQVSRQFKHDYINILSSLECYIEAGDMADLKVYYEETIQSTDQLLDIDNTRLADLQRMDHLDIAFFSKGNEIQLMIRNTVRTIIEPLYQLKEPGFSTKGDGRGLGLSTVETLVNQSSILFLETTIDSNYFLQNLTIVGGSDA